MIRTSIGTRLGFGLRALLAAGLAVGAAFLAVDVADWRYARFDLTRRASNTLDPAVLELIDRLPEPVEVDAFFQSLAYPYDGLARACQERVLELLGVLHHARRDRLEVRVHDPRNFEAMQERLTELGTDLGTDGTSKLVFSCGARRDELELFGELCTIDWGNPSDELARYLISKGIPGVVDPRTWQPGRGFRPASLQDFHGEELFTQALLKVAAGTAPKLYFATGHGEPPLEGPGENEFGRLRAVLERDGFELATWNAQQAPRVPEDCAVLALLGPTQPYQTAEREAIRAFAEGGGRIVAAPHLEELNAELRGGLVDLLREFGIVTRAGLLCQPFVSPFGEKVDGQPDCSWLLIDERGFQSGHPLTEPLRLRGRKVQFTFSVSFDGGYQTESGLVLPLVSSARDSWRDAPPFDFRFNPAQGEERGSYALAIEKQLRATREADGSVRQGRVLALASSFFFDNQSIDVNRDFVLNAFNWLSEREYRLAVTPRERDLVYLDFERSRARPVLTYGLGLGLPGLCALVGILLFLRRRN